MGEARMRTAKAPWSRRKLAGVNLLEHLQIVIERNRAGADRHDHQPKHSQMRRARGRRREKIKLAEETGQRRNPGQRQHKHEHAR